MDPKQSFLRYLVSRIPGTTWCYLMAPLITGNPGGQDIYAGRGYQGLPLITTLKFGRPENYRRFVCTRRYLIFATPFSRSHKRQRDQGGNGEAHEYILRLAIYLEARRGN